jgi:hypothetical protein
LTTDGRETVPNVHPRTKFRLKFAAAFAAGVLLLGWLIGGEASPLRDFFREGAVLKAWRVVNLPPLIVAAVVAGNPHSWSEPVFFVALVAQWFLVGYLIAIPVSKLTS